MEEEEETYEGCRNWSFSTPSSSTSPFRLHFFYGDSFTESVVDQTIVVVVVVAVVVAVGVVAAAAHIARVTELASSTIY